ncbi:MAG: GAF domain-containing protein [Goleter apudmare HA4340-LM2]|jgi:signal transduction histidine kinase|nr:GAF domain-containing protein [Goleter apudmare HA4340-LM2]
MRQEESIALLLQQIANLKDENLGLLTAVAIAQKQETVAQKQRGDRILAATTTAANALLTIDNFDAAINTALKVIGESLDYDRVSVIEHFDIPSTSLPGWRLLYEWDALETISQISHPGVTQGTYQGIEEWYELLRQGQSISCLLAEMPEPFRSGQAAIGVKVLHSVPIFVEGQFWGALGFDDCRQAKHRSTAELALLKTAAACIGSAIQRQRSQQTLLLHEQERVAELAKANARLAQVNEELLKSKREQEVLLNISQAIATVRGKKDLLQLIMETIKPIFGFYDCGILIVDQRQEYFYDLAVLNLEIDGSEVNRFLHQAGFYSQLRIPFPGSLLSEYMKQLAAAGCPIIFDYTQDFADYSDCEVLQALQKLGYKEGLSALLKTGGKIFGCFFINSKVTPWFSCEQFSLFQAIADQIAVASANILANEEILEREREKSQLLKISEAIATVQNHKQLLKVIYEEIKPVFPYDNAGLFVFDHTGEHIYEILDDQVLPDEIQTQLTQASLLGVFPFQGHHPQAWIYADSPVICSLLEQAQYFLPPCQGQFAIGIAAGLQQMIGGSLYCGGKKIGMLSFNSKQYDFYHEQHIPLFKAISDLIANAVANILANAEIQERKAKLLEAQQALLQAEQNRVAELQAQNRLLENRDRILEATTKAANALLTIENFDAAINTALKVIGESLDCDRVSVIEHFAHPSEPLHCWKMLYEWDSPNTVSQIFHPNEAQGTYEEGGVIEWYERFTQGYSISCLLEEIPEPLRSGQAAIGVKALHLVPIFVEGQCWGLFGFDDCHTAKRRGSAELALLNTVATCIGSAIQRQRILQGEQERTAELAIINEELEKRDRLLSVVAQITKDLLETADIDLAIPNALKAIAEVANISRVQLILEHQDPVTQKLQHCVTYEWVAQGITPQINHPTMTVIDNDNFEMMLRELHAGRSIWRVVDDFPDIIREQFESIDIKSSGGVPLFIEGRYIGAVAFDDCITPRHWSQQEIDVLTTAAEGIGAALHRKQLVEHLLKERARTAEERVVELSRANIALKNSIDRLAVDAELDTFLGHVILEIKQQLDAQRAHLFLYDPASHILQLHLGSETDEVLPKDQLQDIDPFLEPVPADISRAWEILVQTKQPLEFAIWDNAHPEHWPEALEWHRRRGHQTAMCIPLMLGDTPLGFLGLAFMQKATLNPEEFELAQALAHQATLAIQLTRLAEAAKQAAILQEQEKAATEQIAELVRANESLKGCVNRLADQPDLETFWEHILLEASAQAKSYAAALFLYNESSNTSLMKRYVREGKVVPIKTTPEFAQFRIPISGNIFSFWKEALFRGEPIFFNLDDDKKLLGLRIKWHRAQGHRSIVRVPLILGDRPLGFIGLCFQEPRTSLPPNIELIMALAQQATLAIHLTHLAEQSRQAAILEERNRMAREIHDTLAQAFTGVIVQLGAASRIVPGELTEVQGHITQARDLAREGLAEARRSVNALRPQILETSNLCKAFNRLVAQMSAAIDTKTICKVIGELYPLAVDIENNLLRIGQEALTNAIKHAFASEILIELVYEPTQFMLRVKDNGQGFDTDSLSNVKGFGLMGMKERSDRIKAQLTIQSIPGQGTEIIILIHRE